MATKRKRPTAKKKLKSTVLDRLPKNEEEYLEKLIYFSERNITSQGTSIDELFTQQAARLRKQLEELRSKK